MDYIPPYGYCCTPSNFGLPKVGEVNGVIGNFNIFNFQDPVIVDKYNVRF